MYKDESLDHLIFELIECLLLWLFPNESVAFKGFVDGGGNSGKVWHEIFVVLKQSKNRLHVVKVLWCRKVDHYFDFLWISVNSLFVYFVSKEFNFLWKNLHFLIFI